MTSIKMKKGKHINIFRKEKSIISIAKDGEGKNLETIEQAQTI